MGAGAVPIIFSNIVWIKMNPLLGISHSLGWLARFVISGIDRRLAFALTGNYARVEVVCYNPAFTLEPSRRNK